MLRILYRDRWIVFDNISHRGRIMCELLPSLERRSISGMSTARLLFSRSSIHVSEIDIFPILAAREDEHVITYFSLNSFLEEHVLRKWVSH